MKEFQEGLLSQPVIALQRSLGKYTVDTHSWHEQVGCLLLQEKPDTIAGPIGYWYRSLTKAEREMERPIANV